MDKNNKSIEALIKIGLTIPEARVYLALSELKESKTGQLCEKSEVASSKIYGVLDALIEKGFVSYRMQNNTKIFIASSPSILKNLFEDKEKKLKEEKNEILSLVEELMAKQQEKSPYSRYKYYEGIAGIRSLWIELTEDLEKMQKGEEVLVYTGVKEAYELMLGLYEEFHKIRVKRGVKYRIIYPMGELGLAKKRKKQLSEVRFMNLNNEAEWAIVGDKLVIQYITQKIPRGFLIEDKIFKETFKQVFDQLWKQAKK